MAVTAKFKVTRITPWGEGSPVRGEVELTPDYAQGRNAEWAEATPAGVIRLSITNPSAFEAFKQDRPFTVTFTPETE